MKYRILLIIFLISSFCVKAQPPETTYPGNIVFEGYYDDTGWGPFNIGFNFTFYGNTYTEFYATSNGLVTFGGTTYDYTEDPIPSTEEPNNFIAAFWDDIVIDDMGKILYTTIGAAPNRKCIIQWTNMSFWNSPILLGTFSVILYEGSNDIQIQYRSIIDHTSTRAHGGDATIGIEGPTGTEGVSYCYHDPDAVSSEMAIRFSRSGSTYTMNTSATYDGIYLSEDMSLPEPGIPTLVSPPNNSTIGSSQTFEWTAASNASSYTLKISQISDISNSTDYPTGTATSYDISGLALDRTYYWAVFAHNATGTTWSEIRKFVTNANPPLIIVPQTIWMEQAEERVIKLQYNGGDASAKTAVISSLPAQGHLYQYDGGSKGNLISSVPANITDPQMNLIYVADGSTGNGAGSFSYYVHDNTGDSPVGVITVNVNPPGVPNFLLAARSGNVEVIFDRPMADPSGKEAQFMIKVDGTPVTISSVALKEGNPYTIVISPVVPLISSGSVLVSYTQGNVASEAGGLLSSFVDQPVYFLVQTITFPPLPDMYIGDGPMTLNASSSSGLPVTYTSSNTSVASVVGNILTANAPGSALITAQQVGNGTYAPAKYVRTLTVSKMSQTIAFSPIDPVAYGNPDFDPDAKATSSLPVTYSSNNAAVAQINGNLIHITGAGAAVITASQPGNNIWDAAPPVQQTLTVNKATQTITFPDFDETFYGDPEIHPGASSSSVLPVTLTSSNPSVATIVDDHIVINGTGSALITASQAGNANYLAAEAVSRTLVVNKAPQTITFSVLSDRVYGDADVHPGPTSSSQLPVTLTSSNTAVANIVDDHIVINGTGTTQITASQAGNENYLPAEEVSRTLVVNKAPQTIIFSALSEAVYGGADIYPGPTSSSQLPVTLSSSNPSVATIVSDHIVINGAGSALITASQAGNDNYLPAEAVSRTLVVNKASQTITFNPLGLAIYGGADIYPEASSSSLLPVTFASSNPSVAAVVGDHIVINGAGSAIITASQAGNGNFNPADNVSLNMVVYKAAQAITFIPIPDAVYGDGPLTPVVSSDSGLEITLESNSPAIATIVDGNIVINGVGAVLITASQAGDQNYEAAQNVTVTLTVNKAPQTITFPALSEAVYGDADIYPGVSSSSLLPVTLTSDNPSVATIVSDHIVINGTGSALITASQAENDNYLAAESVSRILVVNKASQTITFNPLSEATYGDADIYPEATSSSLLPVTFTSSNPQVAEVAGDHIVINSAGITLITASQTGNENFEAAEDVSLTLFVRRAPQTITFVPIHDAVYGDDPVTPEVSSDSGLEITLVSSNTSVASVVAGNIVINGAGTVQLTASQAGNQNYEPAEDVTVNFTVNKADQVIIFGTLGSVTYGAPAINPGASASSALTVSYASSDNSVAEVVDGLIYITGVGDATITATQEGNSNFNPAPEVNSIITVTKASLTFTADDLTRDYLHANPELTYTVTGFVYDDDIDDIDEVPEITTDAVANSEVGTYDISISGGSDDCYEFIFETGTLTITKIHQMIVISNSTEELLLDDTFQMAATSTSGLQVEFESLDPDVASVTGSILTGRSGGTAIIRVYNDGDNNYAPAETTFEVRIITTHRDIMNLFTPNNDGINDYWEIPGLESYGRCEVKIYNRWGKLVFHSSDYHNEWDGLSDGTPVPPAAYYYIISTQNSGVISGTVNIVR